MSYTVLVVDDEELTLRTVSRGLREEGFEVFTAASGEDALKIFIEEKPDLTLLDLHLGDHRYDIRFWRNGDQTQFDVQKGDAKAVVRSSFGAQFV